MKSKVIKQNQPAVYKDTEDYFKDYFSKLPVFETNESEHGRIEKLEYQLHFLNCCKK